MRAWSQRETTMANQNPSFDLKRIAVAILLVAGTVLGIVLGVLLYSAQSVDAVSRENEKALVSRALDGALRRVGDDVAAAAVWNDGYAHAATKDVPWLTAQITDYYADYFHHEVSV